MFRLLHSETIYKGRVVELRRDQVELPDGRSMHLDVVVHVGAVVIVPFDHAGNILFVRQYRHPAGCELLELPAGMAEANEEAEYCAGRELREETGLAARELESLGSFFLAPGYSTELMHAFLGRELFPAPLQPDADEMIDVVRVPVAQVMDWVRRGEIRDAKSLAALFLALPHIK